MDKKILIIVLMVLFVLSVFGLVFWAWYATGQLSLEEGLGKIKSHRVGVVIPGDAYETTWLGTKEKLKELGYRERINIYYDVKKTDSDDADLTEAIKDILKKKPQAIYTISTLATAKAKYLAGKDMPIIFNLVGDPVGAGFAADYSSSATNMTGCSNLTVDLAAKRLSLFKEAFPSLNKILVIYNADDQSSLLELVPLKEEGQRLGVWIEALSATSSIMMEELVGNLTPFSYDGLYLSPNALIVNQLDMIVAKANELKWPTIGHEESLADRGVSLTYGANFNLLGQQCARPLGEVLSGRLPKDIPIQTPEKLDLVVNEKSLNAIGAVVASEILSRADKIIE
jgi:putative tryptophan/tyrosine transport system substrate-binding protein